MKVNSTLADLDFDIGVIRRSGSDLIIDSDAGSTIPTQIVVTPEDARATIRKIFFSGTFWSFLLALPFAGRGKAKVAGESEGAVSASWDSRRKQRGINKPW